MRIPLILLVYISSFAGAMPESDTPPQPLREFRAAWVATVNNIDWPSKRTLSTKEQKAELIAILDRAAHIHLNAIIFQVRPACDALYRSEIEPWSEYLTGSMGKAPSPAWDPLRFAVEEAHKRGLELHAWFNPYRAHHPTGTSPISDGHISRTHPQLVKKYGPYLWLDPGEPAVQEQTTRVIMDVVHRYDVDGIHLDDYFYPYKEKDSAGHYIDFPDDPSWQRYLKTGGTLNREDWRRDNVNRLIERLYKAIKKAKPWVKFGISPFGIWRPGNPAQIQGYDQYAMLYADARKWLAEGWVDYFTPQLYWRIKPPAQSYPVLLKWWVEQNAHHRHIWPGNYTSRVMESAWPAQEIVDQIALTRKQPGATGNVHFSMKALMGNQLELTWSATRKTPGPYGYDALIPASPWLSSKAPGKPSLKWKRSPNGDYMDLEWKPAAGQKVSTWVFQTFMPLGWNTYLVPGCRDSFRIATQNPAGSPDAPDAIALTAVDRFGNLSPAALISIEPSKKKEK